MSKRLPRPEQLDCLRDEFRRHTPSTPKDFKAAARLAGVTEAAARTAWSRGFVGVEPIEMQLARERGLAAQLPEVQRVENSISRIQLAIAQQLDAELLRLMPVLARLREDMLHDLTTTGLRMPPERMLAFLHRFARVLKESSTVSQRAIEVRRLLDNEATKIVGVKSVTPDAPLDAEGLERLIEIANRALEREKAQQQEASDGDASATVN